jgi:hypothetical protein
MFVISEVEAALCSATGDPHFKAFDRVIYNFQGFCTYYMIQPLSGDCDDGLCVAVTLDPFGRTDVSFVEATLISFDDVTIKMSGIKALVS